MVAEGFGERVKAAREARGLSQGQIDRALGKKTGDGYTNKVEKGQRDKNPSAALIEGLVRQLGVSRTFLLEGVGPMFDASGGEVRERGRREPKPLYRSFEQWLATGGKSLDAAAVEAVRIEAYQGAEGDPGFDFWTGRYKFFLSKKSTLDELRTLSPDDFE